MNTSETGKARNCVKTAVSFLQFLRLSTLDELCTFQISVVNRKKILP